MHITSNVLRMPPVKQHEMSPQPFGFVKSICSSCDNVNVAHAMTNLLTNKKPKWLVVCSLFVVKYTLFVNTSHNYIT